MNHYSSCPFERFTTRAVGTNNDIVFTYTTHVFVVVLVYNKFTFLAILIRWSFCCVDCRKKKHSFLSCKRTNKTLPSQLKKGSPRFKFTSFIDFGYSILHGIAVPHISVLLYNRYRSKVFTSVPIANIQIVTLSEKIWHQFENNSSTFPKLLY